MARMHLPHNDKAPPVCKPVPLVSSDGEEWDEEAALGAIRQPVDDEENTEEDTTALIDALVGAIACMHGARGAALADTLLPATRAARDAQAQLRGTHDRRLAEGVLGVRAACVHFRRAVTSAAPEQLDLADANRRIKELFAELQGRYRLREELQSEQHALVEERVAQIRAHVDALPADLDALAARALKMGKDFDRADAQAGEAQRRMIQGLMVQV
ncbi:hypothetical protein K488DRAFT_72558 [Vararia minispora EC-137]|uniref:Uncharacterized protein n=1 Tax=Vararia minispora EC-137 TaxID=1314806 RepID=A0ACB8QDV1_9AGAM|nr:hypothetical protein K488DRAFT_72558 [Vararia minispora EC-137]